MAVYTVVSEQELTAWLAGLGLGELVRARGVSAGTENSTYFITVAAQPGGEPREYVLTIVETQSGKAVAQLAAAMTLLASHGLPVPCPMPDTAGERVFRLRGKPALLIPRITGRHPLLPTPDQCRQIGSFLGRMHRLTLASDLRYQGHRSLDWLARLGQTLLPALDAASATLLTEELARMARLRQAGLPAALIHGDLFRDNALFDGPDLTGVIDFFMAGEGYLLFDLAIVVNDWCSHDDGTLDDRRLQATLHGYTAARPLEPGEATHWPDLLCMAATRFWISRLAEQLQPVSHTSAILATGKDPEQYRRILQARRRQK